MEKVSYTQRKPPLFYGESGAELRLLIDSARNTNEMAVVLNMICDKLEELERRYHWQVITIEDLNRALR